MLLAFAHIEKTGGRTLISILRRNFPGRFAYVRPTYRKDPPIVDARDLGAFLRINPFIRCFAGHALVPVGNVLDTHPDVRFVTLFRDPLKRYVSHYLYFVRKFQPDLSFEEFVEKENTSNLQVLKTAGEYSLDKAIETLENTIWHCGILEEFDDFIVRLSRRIDDRAFSPRYAISNASSPAAREHARRVLERHCDIILEKNSLDMQFYRYVKEEYLPRVRKEYGPRLSQEIEEFKRKNSPAAVSLSALLEYGVRTLYLDPAISLLRVARGLPAAGPY